MRRIRRRTRRVESAPGDGIDLDALPFGLACPLAANNSAIMFALGIAGLIASAARAEPFWS
jgi:hypothetical protein